VAACLSCNTENPPGARFCQECGVPLTLVCDTCGELLPPSAKFCPSCGAPAGGEPDPVGAVPQPRAREERRVVTILFVDLVGFTERSDRADPEDVRRTLLPFHARVKEDIERFGGTLDKFIGDAAMGVFGAPVAHDDDPARAVRAAMRILVSMDELRRTDPSLAVRVAVNTGEAMVSFGTGPQIGEAVAGDVVNTASRMQGLAPHGSVVIGGTTVRAVQGQFELEALPPATVKGKADPIHVWRVLGERTGPPTGEMPSFVGRRHELRLLGQLFDRVVASETGQLVTVVGEPGMGKTRLVEEFRGVVEGRARWLTGRCLPYGESVTFAPAADMVREVAGFGAADDPARVRDALATLVADLRQDDEDGRRLLSVLRTIVGAQAGEEAPPGTDPIPPSEVADAWARVVGSLATPGPLVLHLEDVHWADEVLLDVIEQVAGAMAGRAVLNLCTARPELLDRHPGWGAGRVNTTSLGLAPLSRQETGELLSDPLASPSISDATRESLLERSGGNPLYALEFVRMLGERVEDGLTDAMPETVQAVIAARLDGIPDAPRMLIQDAAVVGAVFWPGALAALSAAPEGSVRDGLAELVRRGLVLPSLDSSLEGQPEFGFAHALIREVAYGRLTRAQRAARHLAAARWLEQVAGEQVEERTDWLARHFAEAAELASASGEHDVLLEARAPAIRWVLAAADLAARLDGARAFGLYRRAVALAEPETRERASAMAQEALMGRRSGRMEGAEVQRRYEEALALMRRVGDPSDAADILIRMSSQAAALGDPEGSRSLLHEAVGMLEAGPPGPVLARAYAYLAEKEMFAGNVREAMESANRALEMAREYGRADVVMMALHIRGDSRCSSGDRGGLADLREALRLAREEGNAADLVTSNDYLAEWLSAIEGPAIGLPQYEEGIAIADRRGVLTQGQWTKAGSMSVLLELGHWDDLERRCEELLAIPPGHLDATVASAARTMLTHVGLLRGARPEPDTGEELLRLARPIGELQVMSPALVVAALASCALGDRAAAARCLEEFVEITRDAAREYRLSQLADVVRLALWSGRLDLAVSTVAESAGEATLRGELNLLSARAAVDEARGDIREAARRYDEAVGRWSDYANPWEEAHALLGRARCGDDPTRTADDRARAQVLFESLGAQAIPPD
jgi:class 3 adenylate cyclase/tetratricopeptide (TPR) repeat protein/ribosomal protein L40E